MAYFDQESYYFGKSIFTDSPERNSFHRQGQFQHGAKLQYIGPQISKTSNFLSAGVFTRGASCLVHLRPMFPSCTIQHGLKSVRFRSFSSLHFPAFGLNTDNFFVNIHIQSECGKIWTRKISNTNIYYAVQSIDLQLYDYNIGLEFAKDIYVTCVEQAFHLLIFTFIQTG